METIMYVVIGLAAGAAAGSVIAWAVVSLRRKAPEAEGDTELRAKAMALEQSVEELKARIEKKEAELDEARTQLAKEMEKRATAEAEREAARKNIEEQKKLLDTATSKMSETFKALSLDALKSSNEQFMELAGQSFETLMAGMKGDFGKRQEAISALVKPLGESLKNYEQQVKALEVSRQKAYTGLEEHVKYLNESNLLLRKETGNLVSALKKPHVRGKWGELTLRRTAELAGMVDQCDFFEQQTMDNADAKQRPDMVVRLPGGRCIAVDSKAPLDAYLDMIEAEGEEDRNAALERHVRQIKKHMRDLSLKAYWENLEDTTEFVIMFLPGESFLSAALENDRGLLEDGFKANVIIATPTTLVTLLKAVARGWQQERTAEHAREIGKLGQELYKRISTFAGHFEKIRSGLYKATEAYNDAVGSLESRVLPSARKFKELGTTSKEDIPAPEPVDTSLRRVNTPADTDTD